MARLWSGRRREAAGCGRDLRTRVKEPFVIASWPSVPVEIVRAAGFRAVFARGASGPTPAADRHLEPGIFPRRLRHLVESALTGRLSDAARIVIPRTSDTDYKCFLYLREFVRRGVTSAVPPVILFDLLQSCGEQVGAYDAARTRALLDELASVSGRTPSADDLHQEIARANEARAAARRLSALRRIVPRVTGTEVFPLLAAFWELEPERYVAAVNGAASAFAKRPALSGPRVLLTGVPVDGPELHRAIESHGAIVVAEVGPWGSGAPGDDVRVDEDPIRRHCRQVSSRRGRRAYARGVAPALDGAHARRRGRRRRVAAAGGCRVRLGLSGAARHAAGARHPACVSARRSSIRR